MLRVDRSSKRVPSASSRRLICRLTVEGVVPSWRAATEKLPASTTRANVAISGNNAKRSGGFVVVVFAGWRLLGAGNIKDVPGAMIIVLDAIVDNLSLSN